MVQKLLLLLLLLSFGVIDLSYVDCHSGIQDEAGSKAAEARSSTSPKTVNFIILSALIYGRIRVCIYENKAVRHEPIDNKSNRQHSPR
jgi:hypothetical protein